MERKKLLTLIGSACLILAFIALPFMTACQAPEEEPAPPPENGEEPPEAKTLTIGVLVCLTGWFSTFDTLEWEEAQLARDMINESGGITINGEQYLIELVAEDCKSSVDGVVAAATKLVYDEGVKFIAGPAASFSAAAKEVTEPAQVLRASSFCTNSPGELGADTPYTFLCHNASVEHAIVGITAMKEVYPEIESVDFVNAEAGGTTYVFPLIKELLEENGVSVVGDPIVFLDEAADFSPIAAQLAVSDADAVFFGNALPEHLAKTLKALRELGNDKPIIFMSSASAEDIKSVAGEAASTDCIVVGPMSDMPDTPALMLEVQDRLYAEYGEERSIHLQIFNSIWAIVAAIEEAQSLDPTVVKDTWENMDTIETPYGTGHMGGLETYGIRHALAHPEPYQILDDGVVQFGGWVDVRSP